MQKPMRQLIWAATTDVLWQSSKFQKEEGNFIGKKAPRTDCEGDTCDVDEHETMYRDLEQEVQEADPEKIKKTTAKEATEAEAKALTQKTAEAEAAAWTASAALSAAKEEDLITMSNAAAAKGTEASEAQETKEKEKEILLNIRLFYAPLRLHTCHSARLPCDTVFFCMHHCTNAHALAQV